MTKIHTRTAQKFRFHMQIPGNISIPEVVDIPSGPPEVHSGQMIQVVVALVRSVVGGGGVRVVVLRVENPHGLTKGGQKPVLCIQRRLI